jgi:hypothetical protein
MRRNKTYMTMKIVERYEDDGLRVECGFNYAPGECVALIDGPSRCPPGSLARARDGDRCPRGWRRARQGQLKRRKLGRPWAKQLVERRPQ